MKMIFPGKTAVYVSYPYSKEHSCKKSEKSLEQLSRKSGYQLTNRQTDQLTLKGLTSTNVENCNVLKDLLNVIRLDQANLTCQK